MLTLAEWRRLAAWPFVLLGAAWLLLVLGEFDRSIASALFYSSADGWLGAGANDWWAHRLIHTDGSLFVRAVGAAALITWLLSLRVASFARFRHPALFVFVAMASITLLVGGLKQITNVDCPWDLAGFGGDRPYVDLFSARPHGLPRAACFPGAHSSSGFALLAFFFALRDRSPRVARVALVVALAIGVTFSLGQQARGAHFLSHDLTSALFAWVVLLALYRSRIGRAVLVQPARNTRASEYASMPETRQPMMLRDQASHSEAASTPMSRGLNGERS